MKLLSATLALRITAIVGFLSVALGAFGAHALKLALLQRGTADSWSTAVLYHLVHATVMLGIVGLKPFPRGAWLLLLAGVGCFSGSLYVYAVTLFRPLVFVTPLGGVFLLAGWLWLVFHRPVEPTF